MQVESCEGIIFFAAKFSPIKEEETKPARPASLSKQDQPVVDPTAKPTADAKKDDASESPEKGTE